MITWCRERISQVKNAQTVELRIAECLDTNEIIAKYEQLFKERIGSAAEAIVNADGVRTVALAGPSCSGKTTTAGKLERCLGSHGRRVVPISIDDFYYDRDMLLDRRHAPDYESPSALDLEEFYLFCENLFSGRTSELPIYDFQNCRRSGYRTIVPDERDIYIFEGIQAMYPEIQKAFDPATTRRVFINVATAVNADGALFAPDEIRLVRRLLRDFKFRSSSGEFTLRLWEGVRKNEEANIFPPAENAEISIDSSVPYDIYVMAKDVCSVLEEVDLYSSEYPAAKHILEKLRHILPYGIPYDVLPTDSVIREFIG